MGYSLSLNQVKVVGQLIEGNTLAVLEEMFISSQSCYENIDYIEKILAQFGEKFHTANRSYYYQKKARSNFLLQGLYEIDKYELNMLLRNYWNGENRIDRIGLMKLLENNEPLIRFEEILRGIHSLLGTSKINSIILPGPSNTKLNNFLVSNELLERLVKIHPNDSCLILQPEEKPSENDFLAYNSFKNFNLALNNFNSWPGILLWNKKDAVFMPLSKEFDHAYEEIMQIFNIIHYENQNAIKIMKSMKREDDKNYKRYSYILHLSDLHFGLDKTDSRKEYLLQLIDNVNCELDDGKIKSAIITGDLVNSPSKEVFEFFSTFRTELHKAIQAESVTVFGNHDLQTIGNRILTLQKQYFSAIEEKKIEIIEDMKIIIIKIDSNAEESGVFAEGKIGVEQLKVIERMLSEIKNLDEYCLIAILHHHPIAVDKPYWKKENFLRRIFPNLAESTLTLADADDFMDWANKKNIKLVLHGHKHVPNIGNINGTDVVACGSSTGNVTHVNNKLTYLTFNIIKYDLKLKKPVLCTTYYLDNLDMGIQHLNPVVLGAK